MFSNRRQVVVARMKSILTQWVLRGPNISKNRMFKITTITFKALEIYLELRKTMKVVPRMQ